MSARPIRLSSIVFDAADLGASSSFWAGLLGGRVEDSGDWHDVVVDDVAVLAIQLAPNHVAPGWPDGPPQQAHVDLTVDDIASAHALAMSLGASLLSPAEGPAVDKARGFAVYADPAGHPFCLCWGQ